MNELREKLKNFMGERDLPIKKVAILIDRHPLTVWKFLNNKTKPHNQTIYRIKKLIGEL